MDKVKVSKEVAEAINSLTQDRKYGKETVIELHARDKRSWGSKVRVLNGLPLDTLIRALYIGYEVEQTPEYKVKEEYLVKPLSEWGGGFNAGILFTLNTLNIKIEGVNA